MTATATPRQLSDAIKADYDEILAGRPEESRAIERWTTVRTIAGWTAASVFIVMLVMLLASVFTGSLLGFLFFAIIFIGAPVLYGPAFILWLVATLNASRLETQRRESIFTLYGITVDRSHEPAVYSINTIPATWLKPELHRTRTLLAADVLPEGSDVEADLVGK